MHFHSLESRIVTLFLVLILAVQLAGFFAIRGGIDTNARASIRDELVIGERVFRRLLEQNADKLTQGSRVLASDFAFRQAIGTDDRETIESALSNHGARIGASFTLLIGLDRHIKAATTGMIAGNLEQSISMMVDKSGSNGNANSISIVDNHPYQIVVVPVKSPNTVGWVAMAFPIDKRLVEDMRGLSSLQVSVLTKGKDGNWLSDVSTLPAPDVASLTDQLHNEPDSVSFLPIITIADSEYSARILPLLHDTGKTTIVVLQRSISEAIAPYKRLQFTLLVLTALGTLIAVIFSVITAKRITGPLRKLADVAKRLGTGDYQGQIAMKRDDEIGKLSQAFEIMRDGIANREVEIRRLAYWDTLTDLPNRAQFAVLLNDAIAQAKQHQHACCILMMDLDRFKNVNDVLGHSFGDALLRRLAERLKLQLVRGSDQVARLGGDEFAILLPTAGLSVAQALAARILKSLETPISIEDQTVDLGAGIGIAGYPEHGADAETLLSRAEVAMYAAKRSGNEAVVYDPAIDKSSQQNLSLLSELRHAVDHDEFRLYVQPKLMLGSGKVSGLEALVRWVHPERGMVYPDHFIPFAEQSGFIRTLTRWVLDKSAALCRDLAMQDLHPKISVNLSARDLLDQDLPTKFIEILSHYGVAPASFCLEITESAIMDDPVRALTTLERLHAMGVDLSIDDFGTGYSSLAYLKRLPVDELKIDKSFVMNMERDIDDTKIVRSTIDLGHNMGLRVVAEGIESEGVWNLLAKLGCDQGQGYFMSKPMPADQFAAWISKWAPPASTHVIDTEVDLVIDRV